MQQNPMWFLDTPPWIVVFTLYTFYTVSQTSSSLSSSNNTWLVHIIVRLQSTMSWFFKFFNLDYFSYSLSMWQFQHPTSILPPPICKLSESCFYYLVETWEFSSLLLYSLISSSLIPCSFALSSSTKQIILSPSFSVSFIICWSSNFIISR